MRKSILLTLLTLAAALPSFAVERHQSFISYDDGGTIVRSADGTEVEGRRNLPVYPDDEVVTARRGRAEIRLSDGNIVGVDRASSLHFRSILDAYEGDAEETVAELKFGKVALYRTELGHDHVRLDTENASYVAEYEAVYSVETDSHGQDRVSVFAGSVEVRTQRRTTRLREGEGATIDGRGVYDLVGRQSTDDFERWFLERAERFDGRSSRYVDRRLSYWADDLDDYGSWVTVSGIGSVWRPRVTVGWRPYYNGYWDRRYGCLTWVSYDPWAWGTYHYGRWAYDPFYGWVWVPGYGYSPAWVYWWYGSNLVGWAPSGWWDCHRSYYDWAYRPYRGRGVDFGFGFYGRVHVSEMDLRPWTFVDSVGLISTRVDRAALTADAVKHRLGRSGGYATISSGATRLTNEELRDPAEAIRRRALDGREGRLTGRETGAPATDLTPYFRRDGNVSGIIRDRVVRSGGGSSVSSGTVSRGNGGLAPIGTGSPAPISAGSVAPITGGSSAPSGAVDRRGDGGRIERGSSGSGRASSGSGTSAGGSSTSEGSRRGGTSEGSWRGGSGGSRSHLETVDRPAAGSGNSGAASSPQSGTERRNVPSGEPQATPPPTVERDQDQGGARRDSWRGGSGGGEAATPSGSNDSAARGSSDVPRRVIDRIGGARIVPRDSSSGTSGRSTGGRSSSGSSDRPPRVQSGGSSSRSGGGSSSGSGSSARSGSSSSSSGSQSSGNRSSGGRINRDH